MHDTKPQSAFLPTLTTHHLSTLKPQAADEMTADDDEDDGSSNADGDLFRAGGSKNIGGLGQHRMKTSVKELFFRPCHRTWSRKTKMSVMHLRDVSYNLSPL